MKNNQKVDSLTPKTASAALNMIRDKYCKELSPREMEALIAAENMLRENPNLATKYLR